MTVSASSIKAVMAYLYPREKDFSALTAPQGNGVLELAQHFDQYAETIKAQLAAVTKERDVLRLEKHYNWECIELHFEARIQKLEGALKSLANEAQGFVSQANPADHGHTNISVMNHWIEVARDALKERE